MKTVAAVAAGGPLVIAHRGASGYLPEHTLPAKAMAHAMGADFLEQDVVATRDGELIVFHDLYLDELTDVAHEFPGRARDDGRHYCIDFDLAEIRQLQVRERRHPGTGLARYPKRFPVAAGSFGIPTLDEEILFIQGLNWSTGRTVGIYPELKAPAWHRAQGIDLAGKLLPVLQRFGYRQPTDAAIVQCFDGDELRRLRTDMGCALRLVQLLENPVPGAEALAGIAAYADGIGPGLKLLYQAADSGGTMAPTGLLENAHDAGLAVHPYTLRADALPPGIASFDDLLDRVFQPGGVDGAFTDFPDLVSHYLRRRGLRTEFA